VRDGCGLPRLQPVADREQRGAACEVEDLDLSTAGSRPRVVIPASRRGQVRILEEVQEDTSRAYTDCVDWSLAIWTSTTRFYGTATNGAELVEGMNKYYGDVKAEDFALHWQARLLFPHSCPDWFTPLPGEPGKIFLNPSGGFDGDPPKE